MTLADCSFDQARKIYNKYFSIDFLNTDINKKLALIAMVCYLTNEINKKREKKVTCYDVICKIDKKASESFRQDFLKSVGVLCQDFMNGTTEFPTFGVTPKDMPKEILKILDTYIPF